MYKRTKNGLLILLVLVLCSLGNLTYANSCDDCLEDLNELRAEMGLPELDTNEELSEAAMVRAEELEELFSHTRPDGTSCFTIFDETDPPEYSYVAENIAYTYSEDGHEVFQNWYNSPGHYKNMTDENLEYVGIASYITESGQVFWVQLFYTPQY